ncbi:MAG TPA: multicopper oxidase domain-containing protein [Candidatus Tumulicola sp.]|jgi:FtsP/CotA-like multicopper oxidase with cupredoxin domain
MAKTLSAAVLASAALLFTGAAALGSSASQQTAALKAPAVQEIAANDNTRPAGVLHNGTLRLTLVARRGLWHPDGPHTTGLPVEAFGETGKPLQVPGPFVRVPGGTRVVLTLRNDLGHKLNVRGLAPPAEAETAVVRVRSGETRRLSFVLDRPGAFGYYGSDDRGANRNDPSETIDSRIFRDAELSGAIVVEAPHRPRVDHVFVLGIYDPVKMQDGTPNFLDMLETINGRSFPATERLTYERGKTVTWAVFNASLMTHPMHLHGFYYRLDRPNAYDEVTHAFRPGEAEELTWTADRAGNWMFHCHIDDHITRHPPLAEMLAHRPSSDDASDAAIAKRFHLPNEPMGGMVIAIRVVPRPGDPPPPVADASARQLKLVFDSRDVAKPPYPGLTKDTIALIDGDRTVDSSGNLGPPIVLTRDEPVAIAITNRTQEQTSVHWHGIALEDSYYDGGSAMGMAMSGASGTSPPIDPGSTFVARFTPPDAGTFMYHAHMDDGWQLGSGLDGALIVMPPGQSFDPATDHLMMISESYAKAGSPFVAIGGSLTPSPISMAAGVRQRLRIAVLTLAGQNFVVSLTDGRRAVRWTPIAKDGRDFPPALMREVTATQAVTIGETRDFAFVPARPGQLRLNVYDRDNNGILVASQPITVTGP